MFRIHVVNGVPIPSKPLIMHLLKDDQKSLSSSFHLCLPARPFVVNVTGRSGLQG